MVESEKIRFYDTTYETLMFDHLNFETIDPIYICLYKPNRKQLKATKAKYFPGPHNVFCP